MEANPACSSNSLKNVSTLWQDAFLPRRRSWNTVHDDQGTGVSMRLLFLPFLPVVACQPYGADTLPYSTLDAPVFPPPPFAMTLRATNIAPGAPITFTADGANPGDKVWFVRGTTVGQGPCPPAINGLCLDVVQPRPLAFAYADATGRATLSVTASASLPIGVTAAIQAIQIAGTPYASQPLAVVSGQPSRLPGPHPNEASEITAWEIQPSTRTSHYSPQCTTTTGSWAGVVGGPNISPTGFSYIFYELQNSLISAVGQDCTAGFPGGCVPTGANWNVFGHLLEWLDIANSPLTATCNLDVQIYNRVMDQGERGEWEIELRVNYLGQCDPSLLVNDDCIATHRYELDFIAP